jgi:Methyltransferase domain
LKQPSSEPSSEMESKYWNSDAAGARSLCSWRSASRRRALQPCRTPPRSGANIEHVAAERHLENLRVVTADMNAFEPGQVYDRVVSVEMCEHMSNWSELLARICTWLSADGRLFVQVFTHCGKFYHFDHGDEPTGLHSISSPAASCRVMGW